MHRFTAATLLTLGFSATLLTPALACSREQEERLLTNTIYREAEMSRPYHASIMSIILTRLKSKKYGNSICSVITWPNQFEYRLNGKVYGNKLALARESARIFLNEYHAQGYVSTEAHVFQMLGNRDSFVANSARKHNKSRYLTFGDNSFYRSGS